MIFDAMMLSFVQRYLLLTLAIGVMLIGGCTQEQIEREVRESRLVVLILPQYDSPYGVGNSTETPDDRLGRLNELTFWYEYVYPIKQEIERAGYECLVLNHGSIPNDTRLLPYARLSGIVHLQVREPQQEVQSVHYPQLKAVGMSSLNYALERQPACIVFLRHQEYDPDSGWTAEQDSSIYCNQFGGTLACYIAQAANRRLMNNALPNGGSYCAILRRKDSQKRDAALLKCCDKSYIPAIVTAITFLNNPDHVRFISQHKNAVYYAQCIARGIVNYMNCR